jgi:hypothetical protein
MRQPWAIDGTPSGFKNDRSSHWMFLLCRWLLLAVDHPWYSEPIDKHAKSPGPEGLLDRHLDGSVFRKRIKYAISFFGLVDLYRHLYACRRLVAILWCIATHQHIIADRQSGVNDFIDPIGRHWCLHWRSRVCHHHYDFAAKTLLIELKGCFALTAEDKIRTKLHFPLLWLVDDKEIY